MRIRSSTLAVTLAVLTLGALSSLPGCARIRPASTETALLLRREALAERHSETLQRQFVKLYTNIKNEYEAGVRNGRETPPTCDVLIISGGGDYGAFGAGFLKGWGAVRTGGLQRPEFEVVSGVSTGALIAPFAFLGTEGDYDEVVALYSNPKDDWVRERGLLFFLPANESFAEVPGLEREVRTAFGTERIARIAEQSRRGRMLVVNTTDLDDGSARPFEISHIAAEATETGDPSKFHDLLLASSGIPGAFPPREIESGLYVDGGVTSNILYGGDLRRNRNLRTLWPQIAPGLPPLRIRYWVILNNSLHAAPQTTQRTWVAVIERSVELAVRASTVTALRHLLALARIANLEGDTTAEVRIVAIPDDWRPPVPGVFQEETMRALEKLGEEMGRDPNVWRTDLE
jgi:hypothetical protein